MVRPEISPADISPLKPVAGRLSRLLVLVGITLLLPIGFSYVLIHRLGTAQVPRVDALMELKYEVALGHLWFEEVLSGDTTISLEAVWRHYDRAQHFIQLLLNGGPTEWGPMDPVEEPRLRRRAYELAAVLKEFRGITQQRYEAAGGSKAGTRIDQDYDRIFARVLEVAGETEHELRIAIAQDRRTLGWMFALMVAFTIAVCALAGSAAYHYERRRRDFVARITAAHGEAREQEERLRTVVENMPQLLIAFDGEGRVVAWNRACERVIGVTAAEVLGRNDFPDRLAADDELRETVRQRWGSSSEDYTDWEWPVLTAEGGTCLIAWSSVCRSFPIPGWSSWVIGVDVSQRHAAQQQQELLQQQLAQSQKLEAVGSLAGGIAHDFNNVLQIVLGHTELLMNSSNLEEREREELHEVHRAAERAALLTRQLLAFSRKQVVEPRVLDLNDVVWGLEKMLQRLIGEDVEMLTILDPSLGRTRVDPSQMEQVLMNLVVNARDAMPRGGKITVETANVYLDEKYTRQHAVVAPGDYVMLAVSDTGVGMDSDTATRIFEPFFTTKRDDGGTGLGLATVYGIVRQAKGNVWVYSEPGQGTTFKVYLPRVQDPAQPFEATFSRCDLPRGSEKILVVEDESGVRAAIKAFLSNLGYQVVEAGDSEQALARAEAEADGLNLLITDVILPGASGRELSNRLTAKYPELRVLYISGYTDNVIAHHGVLEPGLAFLQKPFSQRSLAQKVREVLDRRLSPLPKKHPGE